MSHGRIIGPPYDSPHEDSNILRIRHGVYAPPLHSSAMDHKAALLALVLVSGSLAGCTGDPDAGGGDEFDSEALQDLFDEHFQDFLNNTTITVINNYHNNTTYVVDDGDYSSTTNIEYNNTTINEGDETSTSNYNNQTDNDYSSSNYSLGGSVVGFNGTTGGIMYMIDITFTIDDLIPQPEPTPDYRNNTINYLFTYYDYLTNSDRTDTFAIQCSDYYLVGSASSNNSTQVSYWGDSSNYWNAWADQYNQTIANMLQEAAYANYLWNGDYDYHVRGTCDEDYLQDTLSVYDLVVLEITIPQGYAFDCASDGDDYYGIEYLYRQSPGEDEWDSTWGSNAYGLTKYVYGDSWYCRQGLVGGLEETTMTLMGNSYLDMDYNGQYRYVIYYQLIPVVNVE